LVKHNQPGSFSKLGSSLKRVPFTLAILFLLTLVAWLTDTQSGQLSAAWLNRLGFAPRDLLLLNWERLVTSALVTNGGRVFWEAIGMIALATGTSEWLTSSRRAGFTFWCVHLVTLLTLALILAYPLHWAGFSIGSALVVARDVGPSAGYFGSLGLVSSRLPGRWRWLGFGLVWIGLLVVLINSPLGAAGEVVLLSANLAHALAFPLGFISGFFGKQPYTI